MERVVRIDGRGMCHSMTRGGIGGEGKFVSRKHAVRIDDGTGHRSDVRAIRRRVKRRRRDDRHRVVMVISTEICHRWMDDLHRGGMRRRHRRRVRGSTMVSVMRQRPRRRRQSRHRRRTGCHGIDHVAKARPRLSPPATPTPPPPLLSSGPDALGLAV